MTHEDFLELMKFLTHIRDCVAIYAIYINVRKLFRGVSFNARDN